MYQEKNFGCLLIPQNFILLSRLNLKKTDPDEFEKIPGS